MRAWLVELRDAAVEFFAPLAWLLVTLAVLALGLLIYAVLLYSAVRVVHGD